MAAAFLSRKKVRLPEGASAVQALLSLLVQGKTTDRCRRRLEDLRAADALQLAAGLIGSGEHPPTLPFVCADPRLNDAARKTGFRLPT